MQTIFHGPSPRMRKHLTPQAIPRILCVDDDPEIPHTIELRLREYNVLVQRAYHGMQGFWSAVTTKPDLIIMDLAMPNGNGRHILETLKRNGQTAAIPVIVLTGMQDKRLPQKLFELGAAQYLRKPVHFDDLIHEISRFVPLERRGEEDEEAAST
jgi:CheY-like chemotaxis protein